MSVKIYTLSYCKHCLQLCNELNKANIPYVNLDADKHYDESIQLEELLSTKIYPIIEVRDSLETVYFINENKGPLKIKDGVFVMTYTTIENLLYQLKQYLN